jgi:DNA mismatch repair protein MutL
MIRHIHFHQYLSQLEKQKGVSQQLLFPKTVELGPSTSAVLSELIDEFKFLGFDLGHFGGNSVIVNGVPPQISSGDEQAIIEKIIEDYENTSGEMKLKKNVSLARSLSNHSTRNIEIPNKTEELQHLIAELHKLESPQFDHNGKQIFITLGPDSIFEFFNPKSRT